MNIIKTILLMTGLMALFLFVGDAMGGRVGMEYAFILACGMNLFNLSQDCLPFTLFIQKKPVRPLLTDAGDIGRYRYRKQAINLPNFTRRFPGRTRHS